MANTGFIQARVAYKVDEKTREPLDADGRLVRDSGKLQAILVLQGTLNPDPVKYEVAGTFIKGQYINGEPSLEYSPDSCPVGSIRATPSRIVLAPNGSAIVTLYSSLPWTATSGAPVTLSQTSGAGLTYTINVIMQASAILGQGNVVFKQPSTGASASVYVIVSDNLSLWVLDGGTWHDLGFWFNSGVWNF